MLSRNANPIPMDLASALRGLYGRVAKRLDVDPSYVSRVARGERQSAEIEVALEREMRQVIKPKKAMGMAMDRINVPPDTMALVAATRILWKSASFIGAIDADCGLRLKLAWEGGALALPVHAQSWPINIFPGKRCD